MSLRNNYRAKLLVAILSTTFFIFLSVFSFFMIHYTKRTTQEAQQLADAYVRESANRITGDFNIEMGMSRALANSVSAMLSYHNESKWDEYKDIHMEAFKASTGLLNVWSSFELNAFQPGYTKPFGRRVINAYEKNGSYIFNDYYKNLEGDDAGSTYLQVKQSKVEAIVEPYMYALSGKPEDEELVTSLCVPILHDGKFIGLSGLDIDLDRFQHIPDSIKPFSDSYSFFISNEGKIITHTDRTFINQSVDEVLGEISTAHNIINEIKKGNKFSFVHKNEQGQRLYYSFAPIQIGATTTPWALVVVTNMRTINKAGYQFIARATLLMILGLILLAAITFFIVSQLISKINAFIGFSNQINNGDLTAELPITRDDEIGTLAKALQNMANSLRMIVSDIKNQSQKLESTSRKLNQNSKQLSHASTQQAAEVEEISASLEQMAHFIEQNAEHAGKTNTIALKSKEGMVESAETWQETSLKINNISTLNKQISDIAFQTNILALNAAVEAARAGEHGKGFAVVAGEVKRLADSSKQAAENIQSLSKEVIVQTNNLTGKFHEIVPQIEQTSLLVSEIDSASKEQKEGVNQINQSIRELNNIAQTNAESSEAMAEYSQQLSNHAIQLSKAVERFKV